MAKAGLRSNTDGTPKHRRNRVGKLVRFKNWSKLVREAKVVDGKAQPVYSESFRLPLERESELEW